MSNPPRTIRRDTRVFISAVTRELGTVRKLVKKGLEDNDYHAVEQDNFPPDYRDLIDKLRERIESCDAVIHIAGHCYGAEPPRRPDDAPRRSYTQLEYDIAVELGKPVYVFLTGDGFPADPHEPELAELQELQEAHRARLTSTGRDYSRTASIEELDQKVRSLRLKVERLEQELQQIDEKVVVTGKRLGGRLVLVAILVGAALGAVGFFGWRQQAENKAQAHERMKAEDARQEARTIKQVQLEIAEGLLQELLADKNITAEEARRRAITRLASVKLSPAEIESLISRKIAPSAGPVPSRVDLARAALAKGDLDGVFKEADKEKQQGRELAMLEGTAALAKFRGSPKPEWNLRALAAFQRAMALADPNSATEWEAWTDAVGSAATVFQDLARYSEAEPLLRDCLRVREANSGPSSSGVAVVLNNLALLLKDRNHMAEAEPLYRRALAIDERTYGPNHSKVATDFNNLAELLYSTNRMADAAPLYRRALAIDERSYGPNHLDVAIDLNNLAELLQATNQMAEAEPLYRRAWAIDERPYGPDHPRVAIDLNNLAALLQATNRMAEAEPLYRRALVITERSYGTDHPDVARDLINLAELLQATNRMEDAEPLYRRALAIDERSYRTDHPRVARDLNDLALLLAATNRMAGAEPLMRLALAIGRVSHGPDHPIVAIRLRNLGGLLRATSRMADAEPLYRLALAIAGQSYGPDHPDVATDLNDLAMLLEATNRMAEAESLMARAILIFLRFQRSTGHEHPQFRVVMSNYREVLSLVRLKEPEIEARIKAASEGTEKLAPIVPEVERLLGPGKPIANVLLSLDRQYKDQGKPAVYFLGPNEPIAPHVDELLRPNGDGLNARGVAAFRRGAHADAVVLYEAALELMADQPTQVAAKLQTRTNRASALRELGLVEQARDELSKLLPELQKLPAADSLMKGRARYHLALCQWRLGERASAQKSAEESLAAYDCAPKEKPVDPGLRRQSEELLGALKDGKDPPPHAVIDGQAAIDAARSRYRAREALTKLGLNRLAAPLLDQILGPAKPTKEVFATLDRQYHEQRKPAVWFLPLNEPMAPHLDQLLGPAKTVKEVLDSLNRQYREQRKPAIWFLPLNEPISPHLDELLGKPSN